MTIWPAAEKVQLDPSHKNILLTDSDTCTKYNNNDNNGNIALYQIQ